MSDYSLKNIMNKPERLAPGHRMCAGCGATIAVRAVLRALHEDDHAVIGNATGCLEVSSFMYPYTAWEDSYIHNAFENAGATLSGVETAYNALKREESFRRMQRLSLLPSVVTVAHMTLASSPCQEQWSVVTIWYMSAMTMELT